MRNIINYQSNNDFIRLIAKAVKLSARAQLTITFVRNYKMNRVSPRINDPPIFQRNTVLCSIFGEALNFRFIVVMGKLTFRFVCEIIFS